MNQWKNLRALVVDDHSGTVEMICGILRALGFGAVEGAQSGAEAIRAIAHRQPDVLLVDWEMPGISGLELVSFLRDSPDSPNRDLPIIMVSAHSTVEHVLKARKAGVNEFLVKPIQPHILAQRLLVSLGIAPTQAKHTQGQSHQTAPARMASTFHLHQ